MINKYFGGYCEETEHHTYSVGVGKKLRKTKKAKRKQTQKSRRANR